MVNRMQITSSTVNNALISDADRKKLEWLGNVRAVIAMQLEERAISQGVDPVKWFMSQKYSRLLRKVFEIAEEGIRDGLTRSEQQARINAVVATMKFEEENE